MLVKAQDRAKLSLAKQRGSLHVCLGSSHWTGTNAKRLMLLTSTECKPDRILLSKREDQKDDANVAPHLVSEGIQQVNAISITSAVGATNPMMHAVFQSHAVNLTPEPPNGNTMQANPQRVPSLPVVACFSLLSLERGIPARCKPN